MCQTSCWCLSNPRKLWILHRFILNSSFFIYNEMGCNIICRCNIVEEYKKNSFYPIIQLHKHWFLEQYPIFPDWPTILPFLHNAEHTFDLHASTRWKIQRKKINQSGKNLFEGNRNLWIYIPNGNSTIIIIAKIVNIANNFKSIFEIRIGTRWWMFHLYLTVVYYGMNEFASMCWEY